MNSARAHLEGPILFSTTEEHSPPADLAVIIWNPAFAPSARQRFLLCTGARNAKKGLPTRREFFPTSPSPIQHARVAVKSWATVHAFFLQVPFKLWLYIPWEGSCGVLYKNSKFWPTVEFLSFETLGGDVRRSHTHSSNGRLHLRRPTKAYKLIIAVRAEIFFIYLKKKKRYAAQLDWIKITSFTPWTNNR